MVLNPFANLPKRTQTERLKNVANVLGTVLNPFSKEKIVGSQGQNVAVLNNPITRTALLAGTLVSQPVAGALGKAATSFKAAKTATQAKVVIAGVLGGPAVTQIVTQKPEVLVSAPSSLMNVSKNIGNLAVNPSAENLKKTFEENPLTTTVLAGAIGGFLAYKTAKTTAPLISALRGPVDVNVKQEPLPQSMIPSVSTLQPLASVPSNKLTSETPMTPAVVSKTPGQITTSSKKRKPLSKAVQQPVRQSMKIQIQNINKGGSTLYKHVYGR